MSSNSTSNAPKVGHRVLLEPVPAGVQITANYTLDDIISGKVDLVNGPLAECYCGELVPIPGGNIKAFARQKAATIAGNSRVFFGVAHDSADATEEEIKAIAAAHKHNNPTDANSTRTFKVKSNKK